MDEKSETRELLAGIVQEIIMTIKVEGNLFSFWNMRLWEPSWLCFAGRISGLEEEARQQRQALSKAETEKRMLQEKHTHLEKVIQKITLITTKFFYLYVSQTIFFIGL